MSLKYKSLLGQSLSSIIPSWHPILGNSTGALFIQNEDSVTQFSRPCVFFRVPPWCQLKSFSHSKEAFIRSVASKLQKNNVHVGWRLDWAGGNFQPQAAILSFIYVNYKYLKRITYTLSNKTFSKTCFSLRQFTKESRFYPLSLIPLL